MFHFLRRVLGRIAPFASFDTLVGIAAIALVSTILLRARLAPTSIKPAVAPKTTPSGELVRWHARSVAIVVDPSLAALDHDPVGAVSAAVDAWRASGARLPQVTVERGSGSEVSAPGRCLISYVRDPREDVGARIAVTALSYDEDTGSLVTASILLNGASHAFSRLDEGEPSTAYDLESVLVHELGHALGLSDDTDDREAVMYVSSTAGATGKRQLTTMDEQAIVALYESEPVEDPPPPGCAVGARSPVEPGLWVPVALVMCTALRARRRVSSRDERRARR
jgi:predicted Zn-dependent protease